MSLFVAIKEVCALSKRTLRKIHIKYSITHLFISVSFVFVLEGSQINVYLYSPAILTLL